MIASSMRIEWLLEPDVYMVATFLSMVGICVCRVIYSASKNDENLDKVGKMEYRPED